MHRSPLSQHTALLPVVAAAVAVDRGATDVVAVVVVDGAVGADEAVGEAGEGVVHAPHQLQSHLSVTLWP